MNLSDCKALVKWAKARPKPNLNYTINPNYSDKSFLILETDFLGLFDKFKITERFSTDNNWELRAEVDGWTFYCITNDKHEGDSR